MKNQYFGDKNDYLKYDLMIFLSENLGRVKKFTFIPMLTEADETSDGSQCRYKDWSQRESLFGFLQRCVDRKWRDVYLLRGYFACHPVSFKYVPYADRSTFSHSTRETYFKEIPRKHCQSALILLDPDNGLEVKSARRGNFHKYVKYGEVRKIFQKMNASSVLTIYQHLPRIKREVLFKKISSKLEEALGPVKPCWISDNSIVFIFVTKTLKCRKELLELLGQYVDSRPKLRVFD